jgi:hypothetical protein
MHASNTLEGSLATAPPGSSNTVEQDPGRRSASVPAQMGNRSAKLQADYGC